jgi:3-hydroxybutyryl-CoA dehydratase
MRFSDLTTGYEFPPSALALDGETVARYLAATGDDNNIYWHNGAPSVVPPLAVAALSLRGMAENLALEPGALHTGQELTFRRPIMVGERLTTQARVGGSSKRRGMAVLAIDVTVIDDMGEEALSGRMNLLVPSEGVDGAHIPLPGGAPIAADLAPVVPMAYQPLSPDQIVAGTALGPLERTPSRDIVDAYAVASGDYNPIHVDPDFAARSQFGGTIAHGMLVLSSLSTLLTRSFGMRWINTGALKVRFRNPAPVGLAVTARGVIERVERGDGVQYAVCAVTVENAMADALITGEARVHIPEK